jgi:hypothetical protein
MLSFHEYRKLEEGLIKVPPMMKRDVLVAAAYHLLDFAQNNLKEGSKNQTYAPKKVEYLMQAIKDVRKKFRIMKPRKTPQVGGGIMVYDINFDKREMPANYNIPKGQKPVSLVLDYANKVISKNAAASWNNRMRAITINMHNKALLDVFRMKDYSKAYYQLTYMLKELSSNIEHELAHMIGDVFIAKFDPQTQYKKKNYSLRNVSTAGAPSDDYYTSPVEFEPFIITTVNEFQQHVETLEEIFGKEGGFGVVKKMDIRDQADKFVGAKRRSGPTDTYAHPFYLALKKKAPKRWKIAVAKFMKEISPILRKYK